MKGHIITINGGSSSIKCAVFDGDNLLKRVLSAEVQRIGQDRTVLIARRKDRDETEEHPIDASTHQHAAEQLIAWLLQEVSRESIVAIGHRVVHGGVHLVEHQVVTDELVAELKRTQPLDLAHLPREIELIESFRAKFLSIPQVACFDTAFHRDLPRVATLLPIPRRYEQAGVRRFGFHGLSYAFLMEELARIAGERAAMGRIILAHLGSGASMAAVKGGKPIDTTMAFTPTAGLVMGTRPGDLDPGLLVYMMRVEKKSPEEMDEFISKRCGLIGISETSYDMRDLVERRKTDPRAADAIDLFCYQARKFIGAYAAAMGGLDTLVFAGGIGEHSATVRWQICDGLDFLGVHLDESRNTAGDAIISIDAREGEARAEPAARRRKTAQREPRPSQAELRVSVRVMHTDEEIMIARSVCRVLQQENV